MPIRDSSAAHPTTRTAPRCTLAHTRRCVSCLYLCLQLLLDVLLADGSARMEAATKHKQTQQKRRTSR